MHTTRTTRRRCRHPFTHALLAVTLTMLPTTGVHAAPSTNLDTKPNAPGVGDADGKPVKPEFGAWGVSKEVRGTDGWYMYAFQHPQTKQIIGMIVTNMTPESVERGDLADRLTFRMPGGGMVRLGGNRGIWYMTATGQGGIRQRMIAVPKFDEHPIDRYERLWEKDATLTVKRYIETDDVLKALIAEKEGGALPGAPGPIVRGAAAVDADMPLGPQLERAVMTGDAAMIRALLERDADVNAETARGDTLLGTAVMMGRVEVVDLLLEAGAKHGLPNARGETPLHVAASRNHLRIARRLLEAGADPDVPDRRKRTALAEAVDHNRVEMAELLLEHEASPDKATDIRGRPALLEAAADNHVDIVRLLLKHGADINAADDRGQTVLHVAVEAGHVRMVKTLLDAGAKTDIADRFRQTPIDAAERRHRHEVLDVLRAHAK